MCWSEFFILIAIAIILFLVILFLFNVIVVYSAYFFLNLGKKLLRCITWPFRALGRLVSPQKKNKTQHFHFEDDDIDIRF